jgi:predicted GNAT family N-acyltransferase
MLCRIWVSMGAGGQVAGFFTLSNHTVSGLDLPGKDRGTSGTIPATLIGKLAMRQDLRKQGLGSLLLQDALERAVMGANYSSSRLIVLDAANEKVMGWYKAHSFKSFSQATPLRMYMKMSTADAMVKALRS